METIVFATGNPHKVQEVGAVLKDRYKIKSLKDIGCTVDLPETSPSLEGNALQKARYVYEHFAVNCFSEDTGLEIEALNGEPGVYTARYAGPQRDAEDNMDLVLQKLQHQENRRARFRTVVALIIEGEEFTFEGIVNGWIARAKKGGGGFGYDPIFIPEGHSRTFAELPAEEKNKISHRARAVAKLIDFLNQKYSLDT